ncbi:FAD-linked oxidase C-terminal domain-containing protein [Billgrantia sp. C5P2]|uniref:FAD-linked oxidase C-terminal domain-containing protein n=1 Tax=Billgrantia sp. C5P2 TaxID=3436239 RepID=UPI003DA40495
MARRASSNYERDAALFERLLEGALETGVIVDAVIPKSEAERRALWDVRENFEAMLAGRTTFLYDVSLPIRQMASYAEAVRQRIVARWPAARCIQFGHIADGNLHLFIQPGCEDADHLASDEAVYAPLLDVGESVSAEHGIGVEKKAWLARSRSETEVELMRTLKRAWDPKNLLNPGRVFSL